MRRYRAMYNYKPQNEDEVELCEGEILLLLINPWKSNFPEPAILSVSVDWSVGWFGKKDET